MGPAIAEAGGGYLLPAAVAPPISHASHLARARRFMTDPAIRRLVDKLLRDQPRNPTVIELAAAVNNATVNEAPVNANGVNRRVYMREYMRKRSSRN